MVRCSLSVEVSPSGRTGPWGHQHGEWFSFPQPCASLLSPPHLYNINLRPAPVMYSLNLKFFLWSWNLNALSLALYEREYVFKQFHVCILRLIRRFKSILYGNSVPFMDYRLSNCKMFAVLVLYQCYMNLRVKGPLKRLPMLDRQSGHLAYHLIGNSIYAILEALTLWLSLVKSETDDLKMACDETGFI